MSVVLARLSTAQLIVMGVGPAVGLPSLVEVAEAELVTPGQSVVLVLDVRLTTTLPGLREPWLQVNASPVMEQPVAVVPAAMVQVPDVGGRLSLMTTPWAVPGPGLVKVSR